MRARAMRVESFDAMGRREGTVLILTVEGEESGRRRCCLVEPSSPSRPSTIPCCLVRVVDGGLRVAFLRARFFSR